MKYKPVRRGIVLERRNEGHKNILWLILKKKQENFNHMKTKIEEHEKYI